MSFLMFYVTHPNKETAKSIADELLKEKLVACANILPIDSMYWWNGQVEDEMEYVSIFKTQKKLKPKLEEKINSIHPYEVPCIVYWEVSANEAYEKWIIETTT